MTMLRTATPFCALVALMVSLFPLASPVDQVIVKTTPPQKQKVVEQYLYYYETSQYTAPNIYGYSKNYSSKTPEEAALAMISAMSRGDYDTWQSAWDPDSWKKMQPREEAAGHTPDFWKKAWGGVFPNTSAKLANRIETGGYVIVVSKLIKPGQEKEGGTELPLVFKQQKDGRWLSTQDLESDPVLLFWSKPDYVLQKVVREK